LKKGKNGGRQRSFRNTEKEATISETLSKEGFQVATGIRTELEKVLRRENRRLGQFRKGVGESLSSSLGYSLKTGGKPSDLDSEQ